MTKPQRVVVTSCGLVTSLGNSTEESWDALLAGRCGRRPAARFDGARYGGAMVCGLPPDPAASLPAEGTPVPLDAASRAVLRAADEAIGETVADFAQAPVFVGTTLGGMENGNRFYRDYRERGLTEDNAALLKDYIPFMQGRHLRERFGLRAQPMTISNACSSGANAIGLALLAIRQGRSERAIAVGYDMVPEFVYGGFNALRLVDPEPCRPFGVTRAGLNLGEAAGAMLLETEQAAARGGRRAIAEVRGYGSAVEAFHVTKPHPEGLGAEQVMTECLADAGVDPADVDGINAHATGTPQNDLVEALAIARLFPGGRVSVTANKGAVGHTLGAAGVVEGIFSVLSIRDGLVPPVLNTREPIPELDGARLVRGEPLRGPLRHVLSLSFGFGGSNAALLFSRG